jgi:N-acetyl-alpha-D-muramate 1-phosphate uridylyltransferase
MTPKAIMIFAAGLGKRMGDLTRDRPKPLIPVASRALIDHALDLTAPFPSLRRVVNVHYRAEMIRAHLAGRGVVFSDETDALLETGGGLRHALPLLRANPVFTLNSDVIWSGPNPLQVLARAWDPTRMDALLLLLEPALTLGHPGRGDFLVDAEGRLTRGSGAIYAGAQIIVTDGLAAIPDPVFSLNRVWDVIEAKGRLFGVAYPGRWCDVGQPSSIALAEGLLQGTADVL